MTIYLPSPPSPFYFFFFLKKKKKKKKKRSSRICKDKYEEAIISQNSKIPIPFKKIIINSYVLSKVSYFAPLLGSNKVKINNTQKLINKG